MMQLKAESGALSESQETEVRQHIKEVMLENGFSNEELNDLSVVFGANNQLKVSCKHKVGLFFARAMDFKSVDVSSSRQGSGDPDVGIIPLAIPHGVTKDLSKNYYACDLFGPSSGFATGTEYILKLGSGGGNDKPPDGPPIPEEGKILVPMDSGSQSSYGYLRAYGAAFWCLKIDENDPGFVPVEWLLGYRGGAFFLPNHNDVIGILNDYSVNFIIITDPDEIQAIYDQVNPNVLELYERPRIAVYSSQGDPDPVEVVLRQGKIPYGTYSQPGNWARNKAYKESNNDVIYDGEILSGALSDYEWLHLHHEDFTGFSGGCNYWLNSCRDSLYQGHLGSTNNKSARNKARDKMCAYCRSYYDADDNSWASGYNPRPSIHTTNCHNARRRCAEKATYDGNLWKNDSSIYICHRGNTDYPQCWHDNTLRGIADSFGFTSDPGSEPKPQFAVYSDGSYPLPDNMPGWFDKANKVQKMKWALVNTIKGHVQQGGFLFAQCFAPETFDLSLWQYGINSGQDPQQAYEQCVAFTDFHYKTFPRKYGRTWYSDINTRDGGGKFNLTDPLDPRCQNHGTGYCCDTGQGHTASFVKSKLKSEVTVLGYQSGTGDQWAKYIKGSIGDGDFTFLGGHYHHNTEAKRLVLNNILLGSLVEKNPAGGGGTTTVTGKQKSNYGPVDPDNIVGGGANDYRDRFKFGFNQPIRLGDRILPEPGNMRGPTDQAVDFRVTGDASFQPNRIVIIPITDVPPEVPVNNKHNADAQTVYDLQGKDHPNGVYNPDQYDFGSSVRIVGFAMFEILDPDEYNRDGNDIQTGDSGDLGPYQPGQVRGRFIKYIIKPGEVEVN
jgi:hypothetical protein